MFNKEMTDFYFRKFEDGQFTNLLRVLIRLIVHSAKNLEEEKIIDNESL